MTERERPDAHGAHEPHPSRPRDKVRAVSVYGLVLTQPEVYQFLIRSADEYAHELCEDGPCDVCDDFAHLWHELYQALSARYRLGVEEALEALNLRSPQPRHGGL